MTGGPKHTTPGDCPAKAGRSPLQLAVQLADEIVVGTANNFRDGGPEDDRGPTFERRRGFSLDDQLKPILPLLVVWALGFWCLAGVAQSGDVGELLLDPTWLGGAAWYAGVISQLGAVAWTVAGVAALFGAWLARAGGRPEASRFLVVGAAATAVLLADDLFGFHAVALPQIGFPKLIAQLVVVAPAGFWALRYRHEILRTRYSVLIASIGANAWSLAVDAIVKPGRFDFAVLFEDGPKFLGVLAWATYFAMTSRDITRSVLHSIATSRPPTPPDVGEPVPSRRDAVDSVHDGLVELARR